MKTKDVIVVATTTLAVLYVIDSYGNYCFRKGWRRASEMHEILEDSQNNLIDYTRI